MANEHKPPEFLDEIYLEPLEENDLLDPSDNAYIMVLDNNTVVSITPPPSILDSTETIMATHKLDNSILQRFEEQQRAIKKAEEQERELKLM
ncbi:MAG: hypothetical protein FD167_5531, partial [bacterium]